MPADLEYRMLNTRHTIVAVLALLASAPLFGRAAADEMPRQLPPKLVKTDTVVAQRPSEIGVTLDFAKILKFDQPARTIIIGNPAIVDGTLSDEHTIVLTGKALGVTNMIVLAESGAEIASLTVNVVANTHQLTIVHHGEVQQAFSCAGSCRSLTSGSGSAPAPAPPPPAESR